MRCLFGWALASACLISMGLAGCSNKSVELPDPAKTAPFIPGKDPDGLPAGGGGTAAPGKSGGASGAGGLRKWTGSTEPSKTTAPPK